ncbi:DEAD/DEAH box helicase [Marinococcus halophilus]|uniref:DEAD/DEAH box helicase n=1 Tax=Marinococcus halophilus TaxID=1371 RepID=UPI00361AA77C
MFDPNSRNHKPLPFDELKRMCEAIGHIPTSAGRGQEWNQCVYAIKHYVEMKMIADEEGRQLFDIISGGEATEKQWNAIKPRGEATIGTLIHKAEEQGFKPSARTFQASISYGQTYTADRLEVKGYLQAKDIKPLIEEGGSILLDSPTGSAKTTSVIDAFQEIASKQKHFYVFACPTVALTDQVANDHSLRSVKGQTERVMANAMRDARQGKRVFVSTYDKVPALIEHLRRVYPELTFTLAIDEYHKLVSDYDYRYRAISDLKAVQGQAENVLALSGTPEDIDKNEFDRVVKVNTGRNGSPCNEFGVYTFEYRKNALTEITELLKVRVQHHGWRVIVYMQSKANIDRVKQALRKAGIKTHVIDASKKSNSEYKNIVENGTIDDDVQVLLTTNVIADGVSIYNELDWEVIAVADGEHSPLFNVFRA